MVGVDYVRLKGEKDDFTSEEDGIRATAADGRVLEIGDVVEVAIPAGKAHYEIIGLRHD